MRFAFCSNGASMAEEEKKERETHGKLDDIVGGAAALFV
jgi:hypothetical protein